MSLIGYVFNRVLNKNIPVYIANSGNGYIRIPSLIDQSVRNAALAMVKDRFESGSVFSDNDMALMEQVTITNMLHSSPGDPSKHYSVQGENAAGVKVKGGHLPEDRSKQTQAR